MSVEFCDTNVLVYAYDASAGAKHEQASVLLDRLWATGKGAISIQVLQELFVTLTRKLDSRVSRQQARAIVSDFTTWRVSVPGPPEILAAIDAAERWRVNFWDAMVLIAAHRADASIVWSEDLNDGQEYDGLMVRNPFASGHR